MELSAALSAPLAQPGIQTPKSRVLLSRGERRPAVPTLAGFLYFGLGVVSGPLADRFGSRSLAIIGMILTGLGLVAAGMARSLIEVYAASWRSRRARPTRATDPPRRRC